MLKNLIIILFFALLLGSCASKVPVNPPAGEYGYSQENPIKVGGLKAGDGPTNSREYLSKLTGRRGQKVTSRRGGSCCQFRTPNGPFGVGFLDIYELEYEGLDAPVKIYINMYDAGELRAPKGFKYDG